MTQLGRITQQSDMMGCMCGMRVTVGMVVSQLEAGVTVDQILGDEHEVLLAIQ